MMTNETIERHEERHENPVDTISHFLIQDLFLTRGDNNLR